MNNKIISLLTAGTLAILSSLTSVSALEINETYDDIKYENFCDEELDGLTLIEGAPDGSSFWTNESDATVHLPGLSENTAEYYLWQFDIRFNEGGGGLTVRDLNNKKVDTCIRNHNGMFAVQYGSTGYKDYFELDVTKWYQVQLYGRYGMGETLRMDVFGYTEDGTLELIGSYTDVNARNNVPAAHYDLEPGSSIDNIIIAKLGADALKIESVPEGITELNAGSSVSLTYSAYREDKDFISPETIWKVYDEDDNEITDESVTVTENGVVSAYRTCPDKNITVKVISGEKGEVTGEYPIKINAVDFSALKYDTISMTAPRNYVTADEPLELEITATKDGEPVDLEEGDVYFVAYNKDNTLDTKNKNITVVNNVLTVTDSVVAQDIVLHAEDISTTVNTAMALRIKPADAVDIGETGNKDQLYVSDPCETEISAANFMSNSVDGSHFYNFETAGFIATVSGITEDICISADVRFAEENSGFQLKSGGKLGGQISRQGSKLGRVGSGNKFVAGCAGDSESWYHIEYLTRCGATGTYGKALVSRYDENGVLVHPDTGEIGGFAEIILNMRTVGGQALGSIEVQAGTYIDNVKIAKIVPDELQMSLTTNQIFAGRTTQASVEVFRRGEIITFFPTEKIEWSVYDSNNENKLTSTEINIDQNGLITVSEDASEQTVYIRVTSKESGAYDAKEFTVKDSNIFKITGIGTNEDGTRIEEVKVFKNMFYNGDVTFVIAVYGENGEMLDCVLRRMENNTLVTGESKIQLEMELPESFTEVKTFVWTSL